MSICKKKKELEVNQEQPWVGDLLKRQEVADDFSKLVEDISQPFVIAINSPYGTGKTFFLNRWAQDLKNNQNNIVVFFNAWSTDFEKDPLIPFMHTILNQLPSTKKQKLLQKAKELLISIKDYGNFVTECFGGPERAAEKIGHILNPIKDYQKRLQTIESFKQAVSSTICGKKLLIFVDELERCRPTYAVETLEVIKHLFNIENVVFILGIDRIQLQSTIANLYGADMDKDGYLRRFIDLELTLPEPDLKDFCVSLCTEFDIKNKNASNENNLTNGWTCFCEYFSKLATAYKLSLRETGQCFTAAKIIQSLTPEDNLKLMPILAWLLILKCKRPCVFSKIESISCDDLIKEYKLYNHELESNNPYFSNDLITMITLIKTENFEQEIQQVAEEIESIKNSSIKSELQNLPKLNSKKTELEQAQILWTDITRRYRFINPAELLQYLVRLVKYTGRK